MESDGDPDRDAPKKGLSPASPRHRHSMRIPAARVDPRSRAYDRFAGAGLSRAASTLLDNLGAAEGGGGARADSVLEVATAKAGPAMTLDLESVDRALQELLSEALSEQTRLVTNELREKMRAHHAKMERAQHAAERAFLERIASEAKKTSASSDPKFVQQFKKALRENSRAREVQERCTRLQRELKGARERMRSHRRAAKEREEELQRQLRSLRHETSKQMAAAAAEARRALAAAAKGRGASAGLPGAADAHAEDDGAGDGADDGADKAERAANAARAMQQRIRQRDDRIAELEAQLQDAKVDAASMRQTVAAGEKRLAEARRKAGRDAEAARKKAAASDAALRADLALVAGQLADSREAVAALQQKADKLARVEKMAAMQRATIEQREKELAGARADLEATQKRLAGARESHAGEMVGQRRLRARLRRRLVIKSLWFKSQLARLEHVLRVCLEVDSLVAPALTCHACVGTLSQPVLLVCGHSVCAECVTAASEDGGGGGDIQCGSCGRVCAADLGSMPGNLVAEDLLRRYDWWRVNLSAARASLDASDLVSTAMRGRPLVLAGADDEAAGEEPEAGAGAAALNPDEMATRLMTDSSSSGSGSSSNSKNKNKNKNNNKP